MSHHPHILNRFAVIPTAERLRVPDDRGAQGVTMAFLDNGFTSDHPDLKGRVREVHQVGSAGNAWHGTQTSVVAAGDGKLSDGVYRGLAWQAELVLVAVGEVTDESVLAGLAWLERNHRRLGVRVLSISLGADDPLVDRAVERLVDQGVMVVVAAGNSGCTRNPGCVPPATASSVLTVGGSDDGNRLDQSPELYCSSYDDNGLKPEVIAPAIWVAAPLVPGSDEWRTAERLAHELALPDYRLPRPRHEIEQELRSRKLVSAHYQHVDGTSFAAPLVASLAARMLELNPRLTPAGIKQILMSTATFLEGQPRLRQGFGVVNAPAALQQVMAPRITSPRLGLESCTFTVLEPAASSVELFADWLPGLQPLKRSGAIWRATVPAPPPGRHGYKFRLDGQRWEEDPSNPDRMEDGLGGFNSRLEIGRPETP